jgi:hypothetical protein
MCHQTPIFILAHDHRAAGLLQQRNQGRRFGDMRLMVARKLRDRSESGGVSSSARARSY